ncbi:RecX family transcriptional regulator [Flavobacterium jejuense]|uniref:Regulatory protein RecX n=2 Tax=Flavobacterium jejuense TaxID=1544455 RepID=A0ABX0J060_9FLAO|nr:RecX family transcriptional regulator [Flavobacterium jejuense]
MEYYCAYQERCYKEVEEKLFSFYLTLDEKETILIYLIENNYINEERFAKSFTRGKHNYKNWGKNRIKNELKFRDISSKIIETALKEIENETYLENFNALAEKNWSNIKQTKGPKKNKKFIDFLLRKGYENNLIYNKLNELEKEQ